MRFIALAVVLSISGVARGEGADSIACHPVGADTKVHVEFRPESSLIDLAVWITGITCKNVVFDAGIAKNAIKVIVLAPKDMTPKQAVRLFVDAIDAVGLVVTQKPDTLVVKPGPGMPRSCPDIAAAPPVATPSAPSGATAAADDLAKAMDAGIHRADDKHVEIARELVDRVLADPVALANHARIVPAMKDGKPDGFKLYAIRPSSLWARLGFVNGDTILTVNGMDITTPDKALEAYSKLRDAQAVAVGLLRNGSSFTITITVK
jgi:hypothetical protein